MQRLRTTPLAAVFALLVLALTTLAPAGAAKGPKPPTTCLITNAATAVQYTDLQSAANAAAGGSTLEVRGTCVGSTSMPKSLTITGVPDDVLGQPTLKGDGTGRVLAVSNVVGAVHLNTLTIQGGKGVASGGGLSASNSSVYLNGVTVRDNSADWGGGIAALRTDLVLENSTLIENHALSSSNGSGGGLFQAGGRTIIANSVVEANQSAGLGGGISVGRIPTFPYAMLVFGGTSRVAGNSAAVNGGGIYSHDGEVGLSDTTQISDNQATLGGGVYNGGDLTLHGSSAISNNKALTFGGGVYNTAGGSLRLSDNAQIINNKALLLGGGIYNKPGAVNYECWWGWNVLDNDPDEILTEPAESVVTASSAALNFGEFANRQELPGVLTLTLTNTSSSRVWLNTWVIPAGFLPWQFMYPSCSPLEPAGTPNSTCELTVYFSPWTAERHWKYEAGTWSGQLITTWRGEQGSLNLVGMTSTSLTATLLAPTS